MSTHKPIRAVYPGTFDPITNGHLDIIRRAYQLVDELIVAVGHNPEKAAIFTPAERVEMIAAANRTARLLAAAGIRHHHPDWSEERVQAEVIRRVCGGTDQPA